MAVSILCLFLVVQWVGLQCVIVAVQGHTHVLIECYITQAHFFECYTYICRFFQCYIYLSSLIGLLNYLGMQAFLVYYEP